MSMGELAGLLAGSVIFNIGFSNEKSSIGACLGCKGSLVQIQSRRPIQLHEITKFLLWKLHKLRSYISEYIGTSLKSKEREAGGTFGGTETSSVMRLSCHFNGSFMSYCLNSSSFITNFKINFHQSITAGGLGKWTFTSKF